MKVKERAKNSVEFPCNLGDVIFDINHDSIIDFTVIGFRCGRMVDDKEDNTLYQSTMWYVECKRPDSSFFASIPVSAFGTTVFLDREQAEQVWKDKRENKSL